MAAGSVSRGFWFLFASLPTGKSGERQEAGVTSYFEKDELYSTPLHKVAGNKVHSSMFGFQFDGTLLPDQGVEDGKSKYNPKEDPKDPSSKDVNTRLEDVTCYKAKKICIWVAIRNGRYSGMKAGDAQVLMFVKGNGGVVENSLFVGESEANHGVPNSRVDGEIWHRSLPNKMRGRGAVVGVRTYLNNILIQKTTFVNFVDDDAKQAAALMIARSGANSVFTGVKEVVFTNVPEKNRMIDAKKKVTQTVYHDWDGSLTQTPNMKVKHFILSFVYLFYS